MHRGAVMALTRVNMRGRAAISLFERIAGEPLAQRERLTDTIQLCLVKPGESIFNQDDPHPYLYVVESGLLKLTYLRSDGEEWIKSFVVGGQFLASLSALAPTGCASFSAIAIEACRLEKIPFVALRDLADANLGWSRMIRNALMIFGERKERRERQFLTLDREEHYRSLVREEPDLITRVPQKDLASYLGITAVGLSRIAARVRAEAGLNPG